jgi:hypothetical protein
MGILRCARKGSTKYDMIRAVVMSSAQCEEYVRYLTLAGYISEETSGIWKTTEKGHLVVDACQICLGYLPQIIDSDLARAQVEGSALAQLDARKMTTRGKLMGRAIDRQKGQQVRRVRARGKKQKRR